MNLTDHLDAAYAAAQCYPCPAYREEVQQEIWVHLAAGCDFDEARRRAFAWADAERRGERGALSLDSLLESCGDALRVAALPCPTPSRKARSKRERRAGNAATARQPEKGTGVEGCELMQLVSILRNLIDRNVVECDPLTCAIDVRGLPETVRAGNGCEMPFRSVVIALLMGADRKELQRMGAGRGAVGRAADHLIGYARYREDLASP